jgi:four helix bundle protein
MDEGRFRLDDFDLYKSARVFRKRVYQLIRRLPAEEKFALANQMRRAAVSVSNTTSKTCGFAAYREGRWMS